MHRGNTPWSLQDCIEIAANFCSKILTKDEIMGIGFTEGLLIAALAILLFGAKKIPQLGRTLGESIKNFKEGMKQPPSEEEKKDPKYLDGKTCDHDHDHKDDHHKKS